MGASCLNYELEGRIAAVLAGAPIPGWPAPDQARQVLEALRTARGAAAARPIRELAEQLGIEPREVKKWVRSLVVEFHLPIVGSRIPPYGYYLAISESERTYASATLKCEIRALAQRVQALEGKQTLREFLGQLRMDLGSGEAA